MAITRNFNLFLNAGHSVPLVINANQAEEGEQWVFSLFQEDGTPYIPTDGAIVGIKSDGYLINNSGTVVDGKVVIAETRQMTAAAGKAVFELRIDGLTHGTANFIVMVQEDPTDGGIVSDSDLSLIEEALSAVSPLPTGGTVGQVLTKTANGSTWSDAGTPTQEQVADAVSDWADEHITVSTGVVIDTSLAVAGAAADSKKVGDEITDLKSSIGNLNNLQTESKTNLVSAINEAAQSGGSGGAGGQPTPITLASQMTDTSVIYLYLGSEEGYDYGYIYAYVGNAWTKTSIYGKGQNGADGADGYSPTATVTSTSTGAVISITDENGTTTAEVMNGTATQEQVDAWLDDHPEATTTVQDKSITPNKTTFVAEPYVHNVAVPNNTRGTVGNPSSSSAYQFSDLVPLDFSNGTMLTVGAAIGTGSSAMITNRKVRLYKDGTFVEEAACTDRWASDGRVVTLDCSSRTETVNQVIVPSNYGNVVYVTTDPITSYTIAELSKRYFDFAEGYKDKYYHALGLDNGGIVTASIADGAVTGDKFGDGAIQPRKLYPNEANNLLIYADGKENYRIGGSGQELSSGNAWISDYIPVTGGQVLTLNFVPANFKAYAFYNASKAYVGNSATALTASSESYDITVLSTASYIRVSADQKASLFDYNLIFKWRLTLKADADTPYEYSFPWLKLTDENKVRSSIFRDKVVIATGDSITENNTRNGYKSWCMYLPEKLGMKVYNDGKSGTGLVKSYQSLHSLLYRVENNWDTDYANASPNLILIMGNMNDGTGTGTSGTNSLNDLGISGWASSGYLAVGTEADDINTQSVYGCAKRLLEDLITKYPYAQIGWILSTPRRGTVSYWTGKENLYGHGWFEDYITAIRYQCEQYNVPVLDLYHESGFRPTSETNMTAYMDDGTTHPNTAGTKKYLVDPIVKWIEEKFGEIV